MRNFAICGTEAVQAQATNASLGSVTMEGVEVLCGILETPEPSFDPTGEHRAHVLVRTLAFSCNYRDKALILRMATSGQTRGFYTIGSEFVGVVEAVGAEVTDLAPGERVMGDNAYPDSGVPGLAPGIPTNHGSRERQVLHRRKLARVPPEMSDEVAAAFSIGGQTTYSMIRKLELPAGARVLVTAAKSNTSLFALAALAGRGYEVYAQSTSDRFASELEQFDIAELIVADPRQAPLGEHPRIRAVQEAGGFHGVIDPFFDLYLPHMPPVMAPGGRYVTCGMYDQYLAMVGREPPAMPAAASTVMTLTMLKNLSLIGNCIGLTSDLERALADQAAGRLPVLVDRVLRGNDTAAFLERTYLSPDRLGKVVYRYD
ncbi:putative alcohol dehydrogenase [Thiorhodovibrio winogradskyi]|uniref:Alcohol dehydrogenase n=1 Tax=Thiorhodovibrio winogradskyi TaxID=77007 RepID=A0ABZ0S652_9GAMM|nr:zinc-binding alcohol dehydrogenase family protein [Thiorhodovibrio winogradskyi]